MSEYQTYYREVACGGAWADEDPNVCGCKGSGYWSSELDTWHECRFHHTKDSIHPEYDAYLMECENETQEIQDCNCTDCNIDQEIVETDDSNIPEEIDENDIPF